MVWHHPHRTHTTTLSGVCDGEVLLDNDSDPGRRG